MDEKTIEEIREAINHEVDLITKEPGDTIPDDPINEWVKGRALGLMDALYIAHVVSKEEYDNFFDKYL